MRRGKEGRKERKEKQTQGFRECREVGVGEGEGGDLRDGGEFFGNSCGEHRKWGLQGNGERGFLEREEKKMSKIKRRKNSGLEREVHLW